MKATRIRSAIMIAQPIPRARRSGRWGPLPGWPAPSPPRPRPRPPYPFRRHHRRRPRPPHRRRMRRRHRSPRPPRPLRSPRLRPSLPPPPPPAPLLGLAPEPCALPPASPPPFPPPPSPLSSMRTPLLASSWALTQVPPMRSYSLLTVATVLEMRAAAIALLKSPPAAYRGRAARRQCD